MVNPKRLLAVMISATIVISILPAFQAVSSPVTYGFAATNGTAGQSVVVDREVVERPDSITVKATLERAYAFDGDDVVRSDAPANLTDSSGDFTACVAADLSTDANLNAAYTAFAYNNSTLLINYDAGDWIAYYDNGTHDAVVEINATSPTNGFQQVCARYDAGANNLTISRNTTISQPVNLTTATSSRNVSFNWSGRLDEIRTFQDALSDSAIQAYGSDPIEPRPGWNRTSRFMFDRDTPRVYFSPAGVSVVGATRTTGYPDPGLTEDGPLVANPDYDLSFDPLTMTVEPGGYLVGAPVEFVEWRYAQSIDIPIGTILPLLFVLVVVVTLSSEIRNLL